MSHLMISNSFTRVLSIPELKYMIASSMNQEGRVNLALASKVTFYCTIPVIWDEVPNVSVLLALLPLTVVSAKQLYKGRKNKIIHVKIPEPLCGTHFARFRVYSSFVKRVTTSYRNHHPCFKLENWAVLLKYAQARTLLPNLAALALGYSGSITSVPSSTWFLVFGSTLLTHFNIETHLSPRSTSLLFRNAMHKLGSVVSLSLSVSCPPAIAERTSLTDQDQVPLIDGTDYIHSYLASATNIRNLTSSCCFLHHYLLELGALPRLETLQIDALHFTKLPLVDLPEDAFPALRTLSFKDIDLVQAITSWQVLPLVDDLTGVNMAFELCYDSFTRLGEFFRLLSTKSSQITHLSLDFHEEDAPCVYAIDKEVFTLLAQLPLQELFLNAIRCEHSDACSLLATSFPQIRVLRLPDQSVQCRDFGLFASNSNLAHLSLQTNFEDTSDLDIVHMGRQQPQQGHLVLGVDSTSLDRAAACPFVMRILVIWPNVSFLPVSRLRRLLQGKPDLNKRRADILNTFLQSLRVMYPNSPAGSEDASRLWEPLSRHW
ncbi:hypothetical protein BDV93DRAFT_553646 [Ceratobasidium sp. AG-I]|nr:hypothetical protein BDV93DRAFT_553646 [Ceratobasidium sp. AG-I]